MSPSFRWGSKPLHLLECPTLQDMHHLRPRTCGPRRIQTQLSKKSEAANSTTSGCSQPLMSSRSKKHCLACYLNAPWPCSRGASDISFYAAHGSSRALFALRHAFSPTAGACWAGLAICHCCAPTKIQEASNWTGLTHTSNVAVACV